MDEYITKKQVIEWFRCYAHEDVPIRFEDLEFDIQHMIPEDVAPVRHGRWVGGYSGTEYTIQKCSRCGYGNGAVGASNYCPNCGSKMDEEGIFVGICEHCAYREDCEWPKLHPKIKLKECPDFNKGDKK